jgi:signal transduction histidine kinase/DNA-binding response OmpR family regulator
VTRRVVAVAAVDAGPDREAARDGAWASVLQAALAAGIPAWPATRLALAAAELIGAQTRHLVIERVTDESDVDVDRAGVRLRHGSWPVTLPSGLVDEHRRHTDLSGVEEQLVEVCLSDPGDPRLGSLAAAAEEAGNNADGRHLLAAALAGLSLAAGRLHEVETEATELRVELDATSRGVLALYAELSDQQEQLEVARAAAEAAAEAKAAFLANMSHEIRSPLNAVIGFTSLLLDAELTAEQADYAEMVRAAGSHVRGVIDDVLDLAKIESGHLLLEEIPFDLVSCVEEAMAIVAPAAEDKGLPLAVQFGPEVPVAVAGDPVRLRQVLVNLLANAVKFTGTGHVTVSVSADPVEPGSERGRVTLAVRDTGVGIDAAAAERLFAPFTQADSSTTREFGGTGLGLSICRQLVGLMGGTVSVESTLGVGSTFTCAVVLRRTAPTRLDTEGGPALAGARVLVAHEQPTIAEGIAGHLRSWGAEVVQVADVPAAVAHAAAWHGAQFAVVGSTGRPGDMNAAAAGLASALGVQRLPVIAVTGLRGRRLAGDDSGRGVISVATPVRRAQLAEAVRRALGQTPAPRQRPVPEPPGHAATLRVLVAEDNAANQRVATLMLDRLGHQVDVVSDGEQAVSAIVEKEYDLVLMDLHMPLLDGLAATRRAAALRPDDLPRIVAMTASATEDTRRASIEAGMSGFLTKPVELGDLAAILAGTPARPPAGEQPAGAALPRVLYVDDNAMMVRLVERILATEPVTVRTAADGRAALEIATSEPVDLIMLDLNLPEISGEDLLRRLRADPRTAEVPIVIVSGDTSPATVDRLTAGGATDYLTKPFDMAGLRAMVSRAIAV